jgi:predicted rRNA methylase YqxC with S4 and FtsJ domains
MNWKDNDLDYLVLRYLLENFRSKDRNDVISNCSDKFGVTEASINKLISFHVRDNGHISKKAVEPALERLSNETSKSINLIKAIIS